MCSTEIRVNEYHIIIPCYKSSMLFSITVHNIDKQVMNVFTVFVNSLYIFEYILSIYYGTSCNSHIYLKQIYPLTLINC